jgi:hypothetical protein
VARINRISGPHVEVRADRIYKITEIVDGREIIRYTDKKPATGTFVVLGK